MGESLGVEEIRESGNDNGKEVAAITILSAILLFMTILIGVLMFALYRNMNRKGHSDVRSTSSGESAAHLHKNKNTVEIDPTI